MPVPSSPRARRSTASSKTAKDRRKDRYDNGAVRHTKFRRCKPWKRVAGQHDAHTKLCLLLDGILPDALHEGIHGCRAAACAPVPREGARAQAQFPGVSQIGMKPSVQVLGYLGAAQSQSPSSPQPSAGTPVPSPGLRPPDWLPDSVSPGTVCVLGAHVL